MLTPGYARGKKYILKCIGKFDGVIEPEMEYSLNKGKIIIMKKIPGNTDFSAKSKAGFLLANQLVAQNKFEPGFFMFNTSLLLQCGIM